MTSHTALSGVAGLSATPAVHPSSRMRVELPVQVRRDLGVNRQAVRARRARNRRSISPARTTMRCTSSGSDVSVANRLDDLGAEREVRHEAPVHDVDVNPVGAAGLAHRDLVAESARSRR